MRRARLILGLALVYGLGLATVSAIEQAFPLSDFCPAAVIVRAQGRLS